MRLRTHNESAEAACITDSITTQERTFVRHDTKFVDVTTVDYKPTGSTIEGALSSTYEDKMAADDLWSLDGR